MSQENSNTQQDRWMIALAVVVFGFLLFFVVRHVVRTVECDRSHCDHGQPEMVRGMWSYDCMCVEKPRTP